MEIVGMERGFRMERGYGVEIKLISETQEELKKILQTSCQTLMFVAAKVEYDTEYDDGSGEGARNIYYKAENVYPHKGRYVCTKEEYENLCKAREIPDDDERTLAGKTVVIIVRDGEIVGVC